VLLCPLCRFVCRVNKWVERLQTPRRVRRDERRGSDRQIRVIWICIIITGEQAVIRYPGRRDNIKGLEGGREAHRDIRQVLC
jgi:hypothetical protein